LKTREGVEYFDDAGAAEAWLLAPDRGADGSLSGVATKAIARAQGRERVSGCIPPVERSSA
jgi:hypothetical protein